MLSENCARVISLSVDRNEMGIRIVKRIPHVFSTSARFTGHVESCIKDSEVKGRGPELRSGIGDEFVVSREDHIRHSNCRRIHHVEPVVPDLFEQLGIVVGITDVANVEDPV